MADKIVIEIYKNKDADELTKLLAEPQGKLETGSGAALTAATAAAFLLRAAAGTGESVKDNERLEYITRNAEVLRTYMVHLIDEDVKSRGPLNRAVKEGGAREIEAARHPEMNICGEIVNMMGKCFDFANELADFCAPEYRHYLAACADTAMAAAKSAVRYLLYMAAACSDETYRFVTRRENEINLGQMQQTYDAIIEKTAE